MPYERNQHRVKTRVQCVRKDHRIQKSFKGLSAHTKEWESIQQETQATQKQQKSLSKLLEGVPLLNLEPHFQKLNDTRSLSVYLPPSW